MEKVWLTVNGETDILEGAVFQKAFEEFKEKMAGYGIVVKQFANDPDHKD